LEAKKNVIGAYPIDGGERSFEYFLNHDYTEEDE
jgi:hypothetical protein